MYRLVKDHRGRLAIIDESRFKWQRLYDFHIGDGKQLWHLVEDELGEKHVTKRYVSYYASDRGAWCSILWPEDEFSPLAFCDPDLEAEVLAYYRTALEGAYRLGWRVGFAEVVFEPAGTNCDWAEAIVELVGVG